MRNSTLLSSGEKNGEYLLSDNCIDFNCIREKKFTQCKKILDSIGIDKKEKIGIFVKKNQLIMPIVLMLRYVKGEIHFFNSTIEKMIFESSKIRCNYIFTDQLLDNQTYICLKERLLFNNIIVYIYMARVKSLVLSEKKQYIYYTSGSTGKPKLCLKTEDAILKEGEVIAKELKMKENHHILSIVPCNHVFGQSVACIAAAIARAKVTYLDALTTPTKIIKSLKESHFDYVVAAPFYYDFLCEEFKKIGNECKFVTGGAPLNENIFTSGLKVINFYGSTETGVVAINWENKGKSYVGKLVEGVSISYGNKIIDREMSGYSLLITSPFSAEAYMVLGEQIQSVGETIQVNDYGYIDNEDVYVFGRIDNIININGMKVSVTEIEQILKNYPGVKEVKVVRMHNEKTEYAQAYIVEKSEGKVDKNKLIEFCIMHMEHYKIPKKIEIVKGLKYSELGKVLIDRGV